MYFRAPLRGLCELLLNNTRILWRRLFVFGCGFASQRLCVKSVFRAPLRYLCELLLDIAGCSVKAMGLLRKNGQ